jgi:hypothetical protein
VIDSDGGGYPAVGQLRTVPQLHFDQRTSLGARELPARKVQRARGLNPFGI